MVGPAGRAPGTMMEQMLDLMIGTDVGPDDWTRFWSKKPHTTVACTCNVSYSPTTLLYIDAEGFSRVVAPMWSTGTVLDKSAKLHTRIVGEWPLAGQDMRVWCHCDAPTCAHTVCDIHPLNALNDTSK